MTAAERLKKRFKGGAPHTTKEEKKIKYFKGIMGPNYADYAERGFKKRKSGRNETNSLTRKKGYF
jgi:hypothetical protein